MPLEALRRDITPPGLHYVLTHFDIRFIDNGAWHLRINGAVERAIELSMPALRRDPAIRCPGHAGVRRQRPIAAEAAATEPTLGA
jgi:sulfane dehydrogenase subunit SoxC